MFFKVFLNYIQGYVNLKVESYFIERFINMCTNKKIWLWNIKRKKSTIMYANISIKDFKRIRSIIKKTKGKVNIQKKKGVPFTINKYKKRKVFLTFLSLIIVGLIINSNFIWNIEIEGNTNINENEIREELKQYGLVVGIMKSKIDTKKIINNIRLNRDDVAWIGIEINGTNAKIEIKDKNKPPEIIDNNEYCNIISNKSGMITKVNVQNGTSNVKEGDIVEEGDILVNGFVEGKFTGTRFVHAKANIEAKVWYSEKVKAYVKQTAVERTGNTERKHTIKFNKFEINLYKTLSKFQKYDTIGTSKKVKLFSNFYLPIEIIKITNYETIEKEIIYTEEELISKTQLELEEKIEQRISDRKSIINKQVNTYKGDGYIEIEVIYEVLESIGSNEKIVF